jgi:hypothetical protein
VKKTSIYLEPDLDERLAARAAEEGLTKAEFIRRGLAALVTKPKRPKPLGAGIIKDAPKDVSANVDRYLAETGFGQ